MDAVIGVFTSFWNMTWMGIARSALGFVSTREYIECMCVQAARCAFKASLTHLYVYVYDAAAIGSKSAARARGTSLADSAGHLSKYIAPTFNELLLLLSSDARVQLLKVYYSPHRCKILYKVSNNFFNYFFFFRVV